MPEPPHPFDRRFLLVSGKGGVGKSTVTATLALRAARQGHKTLVMELNTQPRVAELLGHEAAGPEITCVERNLWLVNIDPSRALEEYAVMKLRFRALYKLAFENPVMQSLVRFVPGLNDLLMLGKAFNHERETDEEGAPAWDRILIDAPATGHGITFFRLPKIIRDAVPAGNMHRETAEMWGLLTDPQRTAVHLVALPEELPVRETAELHAHLSNLGLPLGHLFLNMVPPPLLDAATRADFDRLRTRPADARLGLLWDITQVRLGREAQAAGYADELSALQMPQVTLPLQYSPSFGRPQIHALLGALPAS